MYYKIVNDKSKVYKELHKLRTEELQIEESNKKKLADRLGELKFKEFLGIPGQQGFSRVCRYDGFVFINPKNIDEKVWRLDESSGSKVYVPNRKTKEGKLMYKFLTEELKGSYFMKVYDVLGINVIGRFALPYMEIFDELILLYLDEKHEPKDKDVIEITKKEFDTIIGNHNKKQKNGK